MSKFVLGTSALPSEKEAELVRFFEARNLNWWHWLPNLWLVVSSESCNIAELRDSIRQTIGADKEMLIIEAQGVGWAGAAYHRNGAQMGDWLDGVWVKS